MVVYCPENCPISNMCVRLTIRLRELVTGDGDDVGGGCSSMEVVVVLVVVGKLD